jgi:hypothetical protein
MSHSSESTAPVSTFSSNTKEIQMRVLLVALSLPCWFTQVGVVDFPNRASHTTRSESDSFDARFTGKTLRFDYFHSGTANEEHISLDELRAEADWPGSRTRLVDELGLGYYFFEVIDSENGHVIYSRGFDSIFGEWQTTAEAATAWRTFHESQRFPEPRGEVRLVLKRRAAGGEFREIYAASFRPTGSGVNRSPTQERGQAWTVFENGAPAEKLDLLILGDGYTAGDQEKFHGDVERLVGILFETEPFRTRRGDFNVRALAAPASESGISDPRRGLWRDSPLGFRSNAFGIDRYALSYENEAIREVAAAAPYDALAVITNTKKHCGGGIYNLWANAPADSVTARYVFVHELGHSLAGLEDEYYNAEVAYLKPDGPPVEPWRPNVTALHDPAKLKWRDLVDADTPIPTPWNQAEYDRLGKTHLGRVRELESRGAAAAEINELYSNLKKSAGPLLANEKYAGRSGAFEGAGYQAKGLYRSEVDCIMFSQNRPEFCRVCAGAIERVIQTYSE